MRELGPGRAHRLGPRPGASWCLAFFGALMLSGGLAAGLVWQPACRTITPSLVEVGKLGQMQAVAPASAGYRPSAPQDRLAFRPLYRAGPRDSVALHRDLVAYGEILARETGRGTLEPGKLVAPLLARFIVTDRSFTRLRRAGSAKTP